MDLSTLSPIVRARLQAMAVILAQNPQLAALPKCKVTFDCAGEDVTAKIEAPLPRAETLRPPGKSQ